MVHSTVPFAVCGTLFLLISQVPANCSGVRLSKRMWKNNMGGNSSRLEIWFQGEGAEVKPAQDFQKLCDQHVDSKKNYHEESEKHTGVVLGEVQASEVDSGKNTGIFKQSTYNLDEAIKRVDENIPPKTREYLGKIAEKNGIGNQFSTSQGYYWDDKSVRDLLKIYQITPAYHYCSWATEYNDVIPIDKLYQLLKDDYGFTAPKVKKLQENLKEIGWKGKEVLKQPMIEYATEWEKSYKSA